MCLFIKWVVVILIIFLFYILMQQKAVLSVKIIFNKILILYARLCFFNDDSKNELLATEHKINYSL